MTITSELRDDGIRVVTMEHPPVNALTVQGWYDVAGALDEWGCCSISASKVFASRASATTTPIRVNRG